MGRIFFLLIFVSIGILFHADLFADGDEENPTPAPAPAVPSLEGSSEPSLPAESFSGGNSADTTSAEGSGDRTGNGNDSGDGENKEPKYNWSLGAKKTDDGPKKIRAAFMPEKLSTDGKFRITDLWVNRNILDLEKGKGFLVSCEQFQEKEALNNCSRVKKVYLRLNKTYVENPGYMCDIQLGDKIFTEKTARFKTLEKALIGQKKLLKDCQNSSPSNLLSCKASPDCTLYGLPQ